MNHFTFDMGQLCNKNENAIRFMGMGDYGITGCGVSNRGTNFERFLPKNQHAQRKLLNFQN